MFCLKCSIGQIENPVDFAFEVYPNWSFEFMTSLAESYLHQDRPEIFKGCGITFSKVEDYELQNSDIYVDLIFYCEVLFDALLRNKR